ncbi:MAG: hypothetical protein M2R45_02666 [Verrucomicrobia subdivision 3 bacterium]|nr:hypothetical protein [Limisphaerales bacterium]MCS1414043.1 hypothetical protein [Limisphaerales bacterium]
MSLFSLAAADGAPQLFRFENKGYLGLHGAVMFRCPSILCGCAIAFHLLCAVSDSVAADAAWWPHWRGPQANGVVASGNPPLTWSATENVRWITQIPGKGASTPIVVDDHLFVVSAVATGRRPEHPPVKHPDARTEPPNQLYRFLLIALNRHSGDVLWQKVIVEESPHEGHHRTNTYAGGSPVTDGKRLYVSLGSRGVYAFDLEGNRLWGRQLGRMRTRRGWGEASTPGLHEDHLVVPWDQEDQSWLFDLDVASGKIRWRIPRDEPSNWSTPVFVPQDGEIQVIVNGTNRSRGYRLQTGESIWECGVLSVNAIPTPIFDDQRIYCMSGYRKSIIYAIFRGAKGDVTDTDRMAWTFNRHTPYVASPLLYQGRLYMTKGLGSRLSILDPKTGHPLVEAEPLQGLSNVYASPVGVNGHVYIVDREGNTAVLRAGDSLDLVGVNRINDTVDASPVVIGDRLYLRSWSAVYCFAND